MKILNNHILYMNNSILKGKNVSPLKQNMEEGQFSMMRKIFRKSATVTHRNNVGTTLNLSFSDSSSYVKKRVALAIGKKEYNSPLSYSSHDRNEVKHIKHHVRNGGTNAPKKKYIRN